MVASMTSAPSLSLRLRARVSPAGEPDIAAFCGRPRAAEPSVVMLPADATAPASVSLFVAAAASSIPAPDRAATPPPVDAWHVRAVVHGHVAQVQLHGVGRIGMRATGGALEYVADRANQALFQHLDHRVRYAALAERDDVAIIAAVERADRLFAGGLDSECGELHGGFLCLFCFTVS